MNRMKLMLTIVDRGDGLALAKLYAQNGVQLHLQIAADGTATSELMDLLGLTHRERDLLVGFGDAAAVDALLNRLDDDDGYRGILRVRGIALSVPMTAVSHFLASALAVPAGSIAEGGAHHMSNDKEYSLILVTVNQGGTDRLMQTACAAGATGGTVIRGRWVGAQRLEQFQRRSPFRTKRRPCSSPVPGTSATTSWRPLPRTTARTPASRRCCAPCRWIDW